MAAYEAGFVSGNIVSMTIFLLVMALQATSDVTAMPDPTVASECVHNQHQPAGSEEVIVCANRYQGSPYRLREPARKTADGLPPAQMQIGKGLSLAAETEGVEVGGLPSKRAMIRLKIRF